MLAFRYILTSLGSKLKESLLSVLPVSLLVVALSLTPWVDIPMKELNVFVIGALMLILGIGLFNLGADMAMTPMGQYIGEGLTKSKRMGILIGVSFVMGTLITIAEPDLAVLAEQVHSIMNGTVLIATVGVGVGLMLMLGVIKIIFHGDLTSLLLYGYMALFCLAAVLIDQGRGSMLSLSFDSGGVTTGPITVPFLMAIGVGIAMTIGGRGASENSFGLIALCSVGPILAVLALSLFSEVSLSFAIPDYSMDGILDNGVLGLFKEKMWSVAVSLSLVVAVFIIIQAAILKLPWSKLFQILMGITYTFIGLVLFLTAVAALTMYGSANVAEVFLSGADMVRKSELEAARLSGFSGAGVFRRVLAPQVLRRMVPALLGVMVSLFKDTSIVFVIGLIELTQTGMILANRYPDMLVPMYVLIGAGYMTVSLLLAKLARVIARRQAEKFPETM